MTNPLARSSDQRRAPHLGKCTSLPDDGGNGSTITSHGEDLHAIGSTAPLVPGYVGCVGIGPDGTRRLAGVMPDPAAQ